jgi:hypothetical protein
MLTTLQRSARVLLALTVVNTVLIVQLTSAAHARRQQSPKSIALQDLTVPADRLTEDCQLKTTTVNSGRGRIVSEADPFPTNPWSGQDTRLVAMVRGFVDGVPEVPDGPPLDRRQAAQYQLKYAESVRQAYQAQYIGPLGSAVHVFAVTFKDARLAQADASSGRARRARGATTRVVIGPTVVRVIARQGRSECFDMVNRHIESLKSR